jgi:hypothetical protein
MLRWAIGRSRGPGGSEIRFEVVCVTGSVCPSRVTLRCVVGLGDDARAVLTVMLPHES